MASNNPFTTLSSADIENMSEAEARKFVKSETGRVARAVKGRQNATIWAAYATIVALRSGQVGGSSPIYRTQEDFVKACGLSSKSLFGGWETIGVALVDVGLDPNGSTIQRLLSSNAYVQGDVKKAIREEDATEASIMKVLDKFATPDGKRIVKRKAAPGGSEGGSSETLTGKKLAEHVAEQTKQLLNSVAGLDLETYGLWETALREALDTMNSERAVQSATPQRQAS